ncbi:MAG: hypothetical protein AAB434_05580 [Planctomycetota bacterium]
MVDFSRLIRQAEEAKGRPPRPKRAGGARKPRRKAAEPPVAAPPAPVVVDEPPIAEPIPIGARKPVPPPEAILEALIPTDPVAPTASVEPPVEEPPPVRPAALPPPEALAEAEIPPDPVRPVPAAAAQPTVEDFARMAQDEADEGPEEAAPEPEAAESAPPPIAPPPPEEPAPPAVEPPRSEEPAPPPIEPPPPEEPAPPAIEPSRSEEPPSPPAQAIEPPPPAVEPPAPEEPKVAREEPVEVAASVPVVEPPPPAAGDWPPDEPVGVAWESDTPAPVEDGLTPVQRTLVSEVRDLLASLAMEATPVSEPAATATEVLEEPRPEEPAPVPAAAEAVLQEEVPVAEPDLSPEQERLIAEVKEILSDLGMQPRREEEPVAAPVDRIEDVPSSLPGTDAVELPVEEASTPPPAPFEPDEGGLGEILGVVRDEASQAVSELDARAALAEALSPSPPLPEGLTEPAPPAEEPLPEAVAEAFAPPPAEPAPPPSEPPPPQEATPPPVQDEPPPREEIMPFPPPMAEPPPPEEAPPRRRRAPFDPFSDLRRRGKDLLDVGILLVGLAWLAGGLYTGDAISWVIALALVAAPSVDLYLRTTARRSESA